MMNIDGRFSLCSKYGTSNDPIVVGLSGGITNDDLKPDVIAKIKQFYRRSSFDHLYVEKFPEEFEPSYPAARRNFPNGYLILKQKQRN